jgi:ornithine cyclodeaminase/alanine dehydrogenase-like protein (mu-crystallin family)
MVRYVKEQEVQQILTMPKAVELVEQALRETADQCRFTPGYSAISPPARNSRSAGAPRVNQSLRAAAAAAASA